MRLVAFSALCIMTITLFACQSAPISPSPTPFATNQPATPLAGKATVVGRVLAADTGQPLGNTVVRLADVISLGVPNSDTFMLNDATSPGGYTDSHGYFTIPNVAPKKYVIIVGDINLQYAVATAAPDRAREWDLVAGTITDVGELRVILK